MTHRQDLCPVFSAHAGQFSTAGGRDYFRYPVCQARFLDPAQRLSAAGEHAHYMLHENDPDDLRHQRFLSTLADPLMAYLAPASRGLDYGCGPWPALARMLREAGHQMAVYGRFFAPDRTPLHDDCEFVTCAEVAGHFHQPDAEFVCWRDLVRSGGTLAIVTCLQTDETQFANWHYRKGPTHIVFDREATHRYRAKRWNWQITIPRRGVVLMHRIH